MRFSLVAVLCTLITTIWALNFEVPAQFHPEPYCIRDFVVQGELVVINLSSSGRVGDGQKLSVYVRDSHNGNEYRRKKDFAGDIRITFQASSSTSFDVCLENLATNRNTQLSRSVKLHIESGSEARDWNKIQAAQKLKPVEVELRRIEEMTDELLGQLKYLKGREERLRDTNESTNRRVRNFFVAVIFVFIGLGAWQLNYLKQYFRAKHII